MTKPNSGSLLRASDATNGDRLQIHRVLGPNSHDLEPFLLIDYSRLEATDASSALPHHPAHSHRGLEIIQYVLEGELLHQDNLGNRTRVSAGDVQWLSTASGMIHEEAPAEVERVVSLTVWINMAAEQKTDEAQYQHLAATQIPKVCQAGIFYKALCGSWQIGATTLDSPLNQVAANTGLLHIEMSAMSALQLPLILSEQYFLYLFRGDVQTGGATINAQRGVLLRLDSDQPLRISTGDEGASLLVMRGQRITEPLIQYGGATPHKPQQLAQALHDLQQFKPNQQRPN